jgi:D-Tyr-tRNAtyr deacylase
MRALEEDTVDQLEKRKQELRPYVSKTRVKTRLDIMGSMVWQVFRFVTTYADGRPATESPEYRVAMTPEEAEQVAALYVETARQARLPIRQRGEIMFGDN